MKEKPFEITHKHKVPGDNSAGPFIAGPMSLKQIQIQIQIQIQRQITHKNKLPYDNWVGPFTVETSSLKQIQTQITREHKLPGRKVLVHFKPTIQT